MNDTKQNQKRWTMKDQLDRCLHINKESEEVSLSYSIGKKKGRSL